MNTTLVCVINPFCKRLQAGIICPHMQSIPAQNLRIQPPLALPPLRRLEQLPPISPLTVSSLPIPTYPIRPIPQKMTNTLTQFIPPSPQTKLLPTNPSPFRQILIRQRIAYS